MEKVNISMFQNIVTDIATTKNECFKLGPSSSSAPLIFEISCLHKKQTLPVEDPDIRVVCQYSECVTVDSQVCQFPFRFKGRLYDTCVTLESETPWCSLERGLDLKHIDTGNSRGQCKPSCLVQNCPVGYFEFKGNCFLISAPTSNGIVSSVEEAEQVCTEQGARLYQPRDFFHFDNLIDTEYHYLKPNASHYKHLTNYSLIMLGAYTDKVVPDLELHYNDGTRAYMLEKKVKLQGSVISHTITALSSYTGRACLMLDQNGKLSIEKCADVEDSNLGYLCEARKFIALDGPDLGKSCHFPFKTSINDTWHNSCLFNDTLNESWCATEVDSDGVVIFNKWGICQDEREITYRGDGSGNSCIIPFLYDRVWYDRCILEPETELWCPTKLNPTRLFNLTSDDIGYCTEHWKPLVFECNQNYEKVNNVCIRVSAYAETLKNAAAKCEIEGSYLLPIMDSEVLPPIWNYIKALSDSKIYFQQEFSPDLSTYWVGGTVRNFKWTWIANGKNISIYNDWVDGKENTGCIQNICTDNYALSINTKKENKWQADDKSKIKPYICQSKCRVGFKWYSESKKCLQVVDIATAFSTATYNCAHQNSRLANLNHCEEFTSLANDVWKISKSQSKEYWLGYFAGGMENYNPSRITNANLEKLKTFSSTGFLGIQSCPWLSLVDVNVDQYKGFLQFTSTDPSTSKMEFLPIPQSLNLMEEKGYICEYEEDWICPNGYILFQEECYKIFDNATTYSDAFIVCNKEKGIAMEPLSKLHIVFLSTYILANNMSTPLRTGFRRNLNRQNNETDEYFSSSSDNSIINLANLAGKH